MANSWQNDDGLQVRMAGWHSDPANQVNRLTGLSTYGATKQLEMKVDLTQITASSVSYSSDLDNDGAVDGFNPGDARIPAGAIVTSCRLIMSEAAAGGTSIIVGGYLEDGTAVDDNGFITVTATAAMTKGVMITNAGADIGVFVSDTVDTYIGIAATGTFTAGKGRLILEYIDQV